MPLLANLNAASPLPVEMLGDALLSIVRDWWSIPRRMPVRLALELEKANAAILERHRQALENKPGPDRSRGPSPTRKGTPNRRPKGGRR